MGRDNRLPTNKEGDATPHGDNPNFEVFNPDYSVGVACDYDGRIVGIHLGQEISEASDEWLADQILRAGKLACLKSRVAHRNALRAIGASGAHADALGFPTETEYQLQLKKEFGEEVPI